MQSFIGNVQKTYQLSTAGLRSLQQRIASMQQERAAVTERIRTLKEQQDTNDTADIVVRAEQINVLHYIDRQLAELRQIIKKAKPLRHAKGLRTVQLGCRVLLAGLRDKPRTFTIVTPLEANPSEGRISDQSPLGRALLGKTVSQLIPFNPRPQKTQPMMIKLLRIE